uniref:MOB kinase activator-like 3 n=1 Tax=Timema monikensis TaxID=170555 RepID=A0A7R9E8D5_9NEOP|nr:unnamed protein product [Timema monikensis]
MTGKAEFNPNRVMQIQECRQQSLTPWFEVYSLMVHATENEGLQFRQRSGLVQWGKVYTRTGTGHTFRPKKRFEPGTLRYSLHKHAQASLNSGINLRQVVQLPPGEELNDWIAVHVVDFFNRINLIYGTVSDYCTNESCPTMSGGPKFEYLWADGAKYKKPAALPAPQYVALLMDWVESQINNETVFPVSTDVPFPKTFVPLCRKILTRLFRVFVHVYIHHFDRIVAIGAEPHVNTCYKHVYYFVREFDLVSVKELEPLKEMTSHICHDYETLPSTSR